MPEQTYTSFTTAEGKSYAVRRPAYSRDIYDLILKHHESTGGRFDFLLDVGCGPGNASRDLASSFDEVLGVDPGKGMIESARELGGTTKSGKGIRYEVVGAEELSKIGEVEGKVDLLTAATAAHWFDMPRFWEEAAKVLKPGGTVALWVRSSKLHPSSNNASKLQEILDNFRHVKLAPYTNEGNRLAANMYEGLPLPWENSPPVTSFPQSQFVKLVYDHEGKSSNGEIFLGGRQTVKLNQAYKVLATTSPVRRWKEANPELVGTDKDVVNIMIEELREAMDGEDQVEVGSGLTVLFFKKAIEP